MILYQEALDNQLNDAQYNIKCPLYSSAKLKKDKITGFSNIRRFAISFQVNTASP